MKSNWQSRKWSVTTIYASSCSFSVNTQNQWEYVWRWQSSHLQSIGQVFRIHAIWSQLMVVGWRMLSSRDNLLCLEISLMLCHIIVFSAIFFASGLCSCSYCPIVVAWRLLCTVCLRFLYHSIFFYFMWTPLTINVVDGNLDSIRQ